MCAIKYNCSFEIENNREDTFNSNIFCCHKFKIKLMKYEYVNMKI